MSLPTIRLLPHGGEARNLRLRWEPPPPHLHVEVAARGGIRSTDQPQKLRTPYPRICERWSQTSHAGPAAIPAFQRAPPSRLAAPSAPFASPPVDCWFITHVYMGTHIHIKCCGCTPPWRFRKSIFSTRSSLFPQMWPTQWAT